MSIEVIGMVGTNAVGSILAAAGRAAFAGVTKKIP
jgi:hypothetical protein